MLLVFITGILHITTQSAPAPPSKLFYMLLTLSVCMFIKLYINAQSSSLYATLVLPSGGQLYLLRKYIITRGLGDMCGICLSILFCGVCVDREFLVLPVILSSRSIFPSSLIFCVYYLIYWF